VCGAARLPARLRERPWQRRKHKLPAAAHLSYYWQSHADGSMCLKPLHSGASADEPDGMDALCGSHVSSCLLPSSNETGLR